jgi:hypothetical protein
MTVTDCADAHSAPATVVADLGRSPKVMWPFKNQDCQLVLEFSGDSPEQFEKVVALQEEMEASLISGEVDGNDVGSGVVNIFIITKSPNQCFSEALTYVEKHGLRPSAAGMRDLKKEDYIRLWPKGEKAPFTLK